MRVKDKFFELVGLQIVRIIAGVVYISGLTALLPLLPLLLTPQEFFRAELAFAGAVGLILLGFFLVYLFSGSRRIAFRSLGFMTLIPGFVGVLFLYSPRHINRILAWFNEMSPYVEEYIAFSVPKAWIICGIYIIVGVFFVWLSGR